MNGILTYATRCTAPTTTTGSAATTTTSRRAATSAFSTGLCLLGSRLGLASQLDGDLAVKDVLAVEVGDGALSLRRGRNVNEGVSDGTSGARVGGD